MNDSGASFKLPTYGRISKKCLQKSSPHKLTFSGNFTQQHRHFDIAMPERDSMRQDILNSVLRRTESIMFEQRDSDGMNPLYEDPRDVIGEKPAKPPRKRNIQGLAVTSPRTKEGRSLLKEQKRKLTKKYEGLITALMDKCEEHTFLISQKDSNIAKLKEKLKTVLEYNRLFANENDRLKTEHTTLMSYAEECKKVAKEEQERCVDMEKRCKSLEEKMRQYQVPDRESEPCDTAIPLVEVCMSCSSRQIVLNQAREQNSRLQKDMQGLKDVLYRLNVQLSRYQEKLRANIPTISDCKDVYKPGERYDGLDSLIAASLGQELRQDVAQTEESHSNKTGNDDETHTTRVVDLSGLLSAQALAPLFDAYQENLQEKDNLILDYEKQFENINKKSKQIVTENKSLTEKVGSLENELMQMRQSYKKLVVEKETADIEKITLAERAEKAESKLKEVYELYEDKMSAMMRDYETVHREYYAVKNALDACNGRAARTVPADLHERRLDHCKRLLEELKHQYGMENERKSEQLKKAQEELKKTEEKYAKLCQEHSTLTEELKAALKNIKLYRKAAVVFRQRARAAAARATRAQRKRTNTNNEPLRRALDALKKIKLEIKAVKSRAHSSLEELERRIVHQERKAALTQAECRRELERAALALQHKEGIIRSLIDKVADVEEERKAALTQAECRRELERAALALQHKEGIIRSLIDKVADVEEVRLSQTNTHRLQGIVSDSSPDRSVSSKNQEKKDQKPTVKLVPGPGGYFQDKEGKRKTKN